MILPKPFDMAALMEKGGGKPKGKGDEKAKKEPEIPANFDFSLLRILFASETKAVIQAVEGTHNVYFVFKNPQGQGESAANGIGSSRISNFVGHELYKYDDKRRPFFKFSHFDSGIIHDL